ncbi:Fpg/Nei family DNA glycosylase [soil metagenome]
MRRLVRVPEGHTIHRYARLQMRDFGKRELQVSSPQGWASEAAAAVDGRRLEKIDAYGKHLLYRFEGAPAIHVHLGLFGRFRTWNQPAPEPRSTIRLRFESEENALDLSGATASDLLLRAAERDLLARLGPDPLRRRPDPEKAWASWQRRKSGIGAALLDQKVVAGIGNVYRAEILFACGIDPLLPSNELTRDEFDCIWETTRAMLRAGERSGKIVTVPRDEAGGAPSRLKGKDRVQVYRRESCRRCGGPVSEAEVAARNLFWCPRCQPARG